MDDLKREVLKEYYAKVNARQIRLARATVKRYEAGKLKGASALFHYQKARGLLLTHALTKDS